MCMQVRQTLENLEIVLADVSGRQTAVLAILASVTPTEQRAGVRIRSRGRRLCLALPRGQSELDPTLLAALLEISRPRLAA